MTTGKGLSGQLSDWGVVTAWELEDRPMVEMATNVEITIKDHGTCERFRMSHRPLTNRIKVTNCVLVKVKDR